jgi:hypothetical protein
MKYAKITLEGYGSYVEPISNLGTAITSEAEDADAGTKWTIEIIKMTGTEFKALPEFEGH